MVESHRIALVVQLRLDTPNGKTRKTGGVHILCPLCASDDQTETFETEDGIKVALCQNKSHGERGFSWEPTPTPTRSQRSDGLGAELEIWDKLLELFGSDEDFVPYGTVEDRFIDRFPKEAILLRDRYGHRWRYADHPSTQYSMSAYLASRLRELEREGQLELDWQPATGPWTYNGVISQWRRRR